MAASLEQLVKISEFRLTILNHGAGLGAPIDWVASSDLEDPSEFLGAGQVLLTTGRQFEGWVDDMLFESYVERLQQIGIVGIGFGTEVFENGTPYQLVTACKRVGMPLFEVPYRTPFIAIAQWVSNALDAQTEERNQWARKAQRSISLAAIKRRDLNSVLGALSIELSGEAFILNKSADIIAGTRNALLAPESLLKVSEEVQRIATSKTRTGSSLVLDNVVTSFQTLGEPSNISGVLAVQSETTHDSATLSVITTAVALCEIALQEAALREDADYQTRRAIFSLLVDGQLVSAQSFPQLNQQLSPLPSQVIVALFRNLDTRSGNLNKLKTAIEAVPIPAFLAPFGNRFALLFQASQRGPMDKLLRQQGHEAGVSQAVSIDRISRACEQAELALIRATKESPLVVWEELADDKFTGLTATSAGRAYAHLRLEPLLDLEKGEELIHLAKVWFSVNCRWEHAAKEAGIHRHVLRKRLSEIEQVLKLDLDEFSGRAELWSLLSAFEKELSK